MKLFIVLFFVVFTKSKTSLVPEAILEIVKNHYGESSVKIEVFYNTRKIKILDEVLKLLSKVKELKVTKISTRVITNSRFSYANDAIFLFDSTESYEKFQQKIRFGHVEQAGKVSALIYCEGSSRRSIQSLVSIETFESFLMVEKDKISLNTMTMFTKQRCKVAQLIEVNRFSRSRKKWLTNKFFVPAIDNFYGCELVVYLQNNFGLPFLKIDFSKGERHPIEGVFVELVEALSSRLNFKIVYKISANSETDLSFLMTRINEIDQDSQEVSDPICSTSEVFIVPSEELYTSWEKLLLPFDQDTWIWIGITFAVAFFVIFLVKLSKSSSIYEFVIGSNVSAPSLNVVAIFMGIGQILLPSRDMPRFMFINFVLFCLIMRTAYQGKYFEFLTSDMRKKTISTVEELRERNFTIFITEEVKSYSKIVDLDILNG